MHLTRLALIDFRSYTSADLTLTPGVTTLSGPNGEGKTNLAEAIGYVATLGSHRVATDTPLVRQGAERAIIRAAITSFRGSALIEIEVNPGRANRVRLNRTPMNRPREILGVLRTVLFAPEDLALVKGDPGERRRFLDDLLVATAPRFAAVRSDYERVVRQRTALLKSAGPRAGRGRGSRPAPAPPPDEDGSAAPAGASAGSSAGGGAASAMAATLDAWDDQLARTGAELLAARLSLVRSLRPHVAAAYAAVSGDRGPARITYKPSFLLPGPAGPGDDDPEGEQKQGDLEVAMREALQQARAQELERGVCLVGPHRDELELQVGELPARGYASHGESWSLALALRLASYELLRADGEDPVLILDDVFAELDTGRRDRLATLVADAEQVIVTAAVPADVPATLTGARFSVGGGTITRDG
ncbi:MAG TPA: DNA replication/repair protein RecF [Streptosporangiaceae bacterium]